MDQLQIFDDGLQQPLERILCCSVTERSWLQASLPLPQGRQKQLLIGLAKGMAVKEKCAKHTQNPKHANARGSGGFPPGNF